MKLTVFFVLFAIAFLSDGNVVSEALPLDGIKDIDLFQDTTAEGLAENTLRSGPGISKIILVADADLLRMLKALGRNIPERLPSPDGRDESLDPSSSISIIRRDTKSAPLGVDRVDNSVNQRPIPFPLSHGKLSGSKGLSDIINGGS
ncbi:Pro-MCH 1 [Bagarius yarrelli]|uniref:Pro-MCH 1 n=1 Tax=Bagarius yarrelli TaxID=175774 RepID=A0A556TYB8_BAGYA|nr:Pro-MCH 1 [Bagarius yarrelli]